MLAYRRQRPACFAARCSLRHASHVVRLSQSACYINVGIQAPYPALPPHGTVHNSRTTYAEPKCYNLKIVGGPLGPPAEPYRRGRVGWGNQLLLFWRLLRWRMAGARRDSMYIKGACSKSGIRDHISGPDWRP